MNDHIPTSTLVTLNLAGHTGLIEGHEEVNQAADKFFNGLNVDNPM